jgi:hypothetical protein
MRKSYIGWWIASAFCFMCLYNSYGYGAGDDFTVGLFFLLGCLFLYLGFRRHKEYKEYQEDRRIRNELYQKLKEDPRIVQSAPSSAPARSAEPSMTVMTADMKRREEERAARQKKMNDSLREQNPMGRFEIMCEKYIDGNERIRNTILSALSPEDQQTFLIGVGLYRLFTDQAYYRAVRDALGEQIWKEVRQKVVQ